MSTLITDTHRSKPAYVYVRQSTLAQVRHNQESTEPQWEWPAQLVRMRHEVLGQSAVHG